MPTLAADEIVRMRDSVLFDGPDISKRISRFWVLFILASIIAAAGVVADSTATVIGAMIVAPLMIPIQGTMLSVVLADRANLVRSVGLVIAGAAAAVAIGYLVGLTVVNHVVADTNSQVAGRVHPHLIDLLAALATGVVGSVALVRRDSPTRFPVSRSPSHSCRLSASSASRSRPGRTASRSVRSCSFSRTWRRSSLPGSS